MLSDLRYYFLNFCRKISEMFLTTMKYIYEFLRIIVKRSTTSLIYSTSSFLNSIFILDITKFLFIQVIILLFNNNFFLFIKIACMEQMMSFFTVRLTKEFLIKFYYEWILMRFSDRFCFIFSIDCFALALMNIGVAMMQWLSATTDAASRTSHYFYCMNFDFLILHHPEAFLAFPRPCAIPILIGSSVKIKSCLTDPFHTP
jgi:hypothetical protein